MNVQYKIAIAAFVAAIVLLVLDNFVLNRPQPGTIAVAQQSLLTPIAMFLFASAAVAGFFGYITAHAKARGKGKR